MLNLIFFTTSKVKLAHTRYMAGKHPLKIEGFKQKTYHASYSEPQIKTREELLKSSYLSALKQAQKAHIDTSKRFFFLEDTSVKIDALSKPEEEIPGVDIKYWMENQTFESLDALLKKKDTNRKATVRSDILLHIPETYRARWGIRDYLIFTGFQHGSITTKEHKIQTNLIFPWLDNKTFNKWFVPLGASLPISLLPIKEADEFDFRKNAFSKMITFFLEKGLLQNEYKQASLSLETCPALIVCGFTCAGKTTISQSLIRKHGYLHIEASDFMYLNYYLRHDVSSEIKIGDFAEKALIDRPEIASEKIAEYMEEINNLPTIISGFRSIREIEWLKHYFENRINFNVIFIEANRNIRHERYNKRNRNKSKLSKDQFSELDKQQERMGLNDIANDKNVKTIMNESDLDDFYIAFDKNITTNQNLLKSRAIEFLIFQKFSNSIKLEDAIFIALLSKWKDSEDRSYFTTTNISKIINDIFPKIKPKHKDNVSRYFNQNFYAFYEIEPNPDESKRKYRLSNTGYGRAVQIYFQLLNNGLSPEN